MSRAGPAAVAVLASALGLACSSADGPVAARVPAPDLNRPLRTAAIDDCVLPRRPRGLAAYTADGTRLPFTVAAGHEPGTRPRCRPGELRMLRLAALTIAGQPAYLRRGGCQEPCRVRQPTVHLLADELTRPVALLGAAVLAGDGRAVASCPRAVRAAPALARADLGQLYYKTPAELHRTHLRTGIIGAGARWSNYGDPGRRFRPRADYTYLLWNLPRRASGGLLPGGGIVEAVIAEGQAVALCAVPTLTLPAFDVAGRPAGEVVFGYARAQAGRPIYGWLLLGYRHRGASRRALTVPSPLGDKP